MIKKSVTIGIIAVLALTFSSCTGSERLTNMTIVQGLALDVSDDRIIATVQYLDLNKGNGKNEKISGNLTSHESASCKTIKSAVTAVEKKLPDSLFFGQNKIIVISPEFDRKYDEKLRDYLVKNKESRPDVLIFKSEGKASDVLNKSHKNTRVPAESICSQLEKSKSDITVSEYLAGDGLKTYKIS